MVQKEREMSGEIYFYVLFKTTAPDGSAFFGITRTQNPSYGQDGTPIPYIGNGPKLQAKARQFGIAALVCEVLQVDTSYDLIRRRLDGILTPATLADPRCLNMSQPATNAKISEALTDKPKSDSHKEAIAVAMAGNSNALGHVLSEETKEVIADKLSKVKWYHNKTTGEQIQLDADEEALTGFELGKLPKELVSKFKKDRKVELSDADRARMIRD
jgi:hypothetical protein